MHKRSIKWMAWVCLESQGSLLRGGNIYAKTENEQELPDELKAVPCRGDSTCRDRVRTGVGILEGCREGQKDGSAENRGQR